VHASTPASTASFVEQSQSIDIAGRAMRAARIFPVRSNMKKYVIVLVQQGVS